MQETIKRWLVLACCIALCACEAQTAEPSPLPTAEATPVATLDANAFMPENARVITSEEVDTDGDGTSELLIILGQGGAGRGIVVRREGAGAVAYWLGGEKRTELFRAALGRKIVRDVNGDGKVEIVIEGIVGGVAAALNVFQWNGKEYVALLSLTGADGIAMDEPRRDGVLDFTALETLFRSSAIIRATHAEWNQSAYSVKSHVLFVFGAPLGLGYPEETALAYYVHWNKRESGKMFELLGDAQKARTPLAALEGLSGKVESVGVESLSIDEETAEQALIALNVRYLERGAQVEQSEKHVWRLQREGKAWRLTERLH